MNTQQLKRCCVCKNDLPRDSFYRNAARMDGLDTLCKECRLTKTREKSKTEQGRKINRESMRRQRLSGRRQSYEQQYRTRPERRIAARAAVAKHRKTEKGKAAQRAYNTNDAARARHALLRNANRPMRLAHKAVTLAIYHKTLPKASECACTHCEKTAGDYHHHNGYDEQHWLDVIPLCKSCHRLAHSTCAIS